MTRTFRPILLSAFSSVACLAVAQEGKGGTAPRTYGIWDRIELITSTWWLTTVIATSLLGLLVGFFVYKNAVTTGRASGATGSGCLVAVIVFLVAQVFAVIMLVTTVFSAPNITEPAQSATTQTATPTDTAKPASTTTGGDTAQKSASGTTGTSTSSPKTGTTTSGDDF